MSNGIIERAIGYDIIKHNSEQIVYKYVSVERAKQILNDGKIYFAPCDNSNDPYDLHINLIDFRIDDDTRKAIALLALADNGINDFTELEIKNALNGMSEEIFINNMKGGYEDQRKRAGMFCTSENFKNILMWSHYGEKHTGVCLGFKLKNAKQNGYIGMKVKYRKVFDKIKLSMLNETEEDSLPLIYWAFTKPIDWSYEREVRFLNLKGNGEQSFDNDELVEIYFGLGTTETNIWDIQNIISNRGYTFKKMGKIKMVDSSFCLDYSPIDIGISRY